MKTKEAKTVLRGMGRMFVWMFMSLPSEKGSFYRCQCGGPCGVSSRFYTSVDRECGFCGEGIDYSDVEDRNVQRYLAKKALNEY